LYEEGLRYHDIIISINNIPLIDENHAINIINSYYYGKRKLNLEILKKKQNINKSKNVFIKLIS